MSSRQYTYSEVSFLSTLEEAYEQQFHGHGERFMREDVEEFARGRCEMTLYCDLVAHGDITFALDGEIEGIAVPEGAS